MREVLLPTQGDSHLVGMWMRFFERWQDEIDRLRIHVNNYTHGIALKKMVEEARGDYLLLIEDDGIIFTKGIVDKCFRKLENGVCDVIASCRMSCSAELADKAKETWGLNYEGLGDKGPSFWPNFFFVRRDLLLKTDMNFANRGWKKGDLIELPNNIKWTVDSNAVAGDTFVWMSLQLRALGAKILEIPQYHSSPYDLEHYEKKEGVFGEQVDWVHIGSMTGDFTQPHSEIEQLETEKRVMWHELCGHRVDDAVKFYNLDIARIEKWKEVYKELLHL